MFNSLYDYYLPQKVNIDDLNNSFESDIESNNLLKEIRHSIFFRNITQLKDALRICRIKSEKMIKSFIALSCLISLVPIPGLYSISSLEIILFSCILGIYGFKLNTIEIKNTLKSFGASVVGATAGYTLGNALLLIPGIGTIIGTIIKGSVASITVYGIGKLCIKYCEENFEKANALEFYKNMAINYNNAIDSLKTISHNYNEEKII